MGWRAQPTAIVAFDNCKVPVENRIGPEGEGFKYAMKGLDGGRLNIAACALGGAQDALDRALAYVQERKQFGKRIADFQNTQFMLADMETDLAASRALLHQAAKKLDAQGAGRDQVLRHGQALRHRHRVQGRRPGAAAARRLRLSGGLRSRAHRARSARAPHSRRHQRDHARDRLARNAEALSRPDRAALKRDFETVRAVLFEDWNPVGV